VVSSAKRLFDFIQKLEGVAAFAIHLVDEGDDGNVAQATHLEQLPRPRFDALGGVDHHDSGIDRGSGSGKCPRRNPRGPGVSRRLNTRPSNSKVITEVTTEMPRSRSIFIQSERGIASFSLGLDLPCEIDRAAEQQHFSVSVVLPASGCEMIAKVRRRATSVASGERDGDSGCESKVGHEAERLAGKPGRIKEDRHTSIWELRA